MPLLHDLRLQILVNETLQLKDEKNPDAPPAVVTRHILRIHYNGETRIELFAEPLTILQAAEKVTEQWHNAMVQLVRTQKQQEKQREHAPKIILPGGSA